MKTRVLILVGGLLSAFSPAHSESPVPLTIFYPQEAQYQGGFTAHGNTDIKKNPTGGGLAITVKAWNSGFVWWFANHTQLPKAEIESWGDYAIRVEIRSLGESREIEAAASWRGVDPTMPTPFFSPASKISAFLDADAWGELIFPAPDIYEFSVEKINGLLFILREGQYEIRRIEVIPAN